MPRFAEAADLGAYGETFPVKETDLLRFLAGKLKSAEASGQLEALNRRFAETARRHIETPAPVPGLVETVKPRSWLFDPSFTVPENIADNKGRVFAHAGDRINPLDRMPGFNRVLIFFDGTVKAQVEFALARSRTLGSDRVMLILTKGTPIELMRKRKQGVYFDQQGLLIGRFGIKQVPAIVERAGDQLKISEVRP